VRLARELGAHFFTPGSRITLNEFPGKVRVNEPPAMANDSVFGATLDGSFNEFSSDGSAEVRTVALASVAPASPLRSRAVSVGLGRY